MNWNFGGLPPEFCREDKSRFGVVPVPFERTTSYGKGTARGPAAIVRASEYLELFDEVYRLQPADLGIRTEPPLDFSFETIPDCLNHICLRCTDLLKLERFMVYLGGEHSITYPIVRAYRERFPRLSVLQIDAHADLRETYEDSPFSHACVMRRVTEVCPAVQVAVRSLSIEEYEAVPRLPTCLIFAHELAADWEKSIEKMLANLTETVYITFDLDGFDPSMLPATGTPEPGGIFWREAMQLLERVFAAKEVVGGDVVELAPKDGFPASDFLAAKLAYKFMAMKLVYA